MPRIAYLYSRYPVVSQTFCDSEMLALEAMGFDLEVVSLNPPPDSFRHERLDRLRAEIHYPPPEEVLDAKAASPAFTENLAPLIADHDQRYGKSFKALTRARNAWHFAPLLRSLGVTHVHVHFANRATHTALFLKKLGFTFSFTAHAQDFMVDLGSDDLLREMVREAAFVVAVSDFSRALLCGTCPGNEAKVVRIYNGIELDDFPTAQPERVGRLRLVSVGRLIEFKGFQHLVAAVGLLKERGVAVEARIIGEGPLRAELETQISTAGLADHVSLLGVRSQEQIKRELAEAHVFVLPSIVDRKGASDILPTVITEAMACCLPVVSTRLAGIPEMVADGETGVLVEPQDDAALANAIALLAEHPEMRQQMGRAGRLRAERLFALPVTAGDLAGRFHAVAGTATPRTEAPIACLVSAWDGGASLRPLAADPRARLLSADLCPDASLLEKMELLPDAVVLESLWLCRPQWRQQVEKLRSVIGAALTGEDFYLQARRAVWMADALPRRGVKLIHAHGAGAIPAVWLCKKLSGLRASAAVEEAPSLSRSALAKLLPDFDFASVSDEKLASTPVHGVKDVLHLKKPPTHRELRFGPLRLKIRASAPVEDRSALIRGWIDQLASSLHA